MSYRMLSALVVAATLSPAFGGTIYDNGTFNGLNGSAMADFKQADDFVLGSLFSVTGFTFWSLELSGAYLGSITYSINANAGGISGAVVISGNAAATRNAAGTAQGFNVFQNNISFAATNLAAGTYWLVLHDGLATDIAFQDFYFATADVTAGNTASSRGREQSVNPPSGTWDDNSEEHAFLISGDPVGPIPEPASLALVAGGLALLGFRMYSR